MIHLIKAEFYKQRVNGLMALYFIIMSILGIGLSIINIPDSGTYTCFYDYNYLISYSMMIYMVIATIAAFYHIKDFSDKSIQHAIMSGYTRKDVILSKIIAINVLSIVAFILYTGLGIITSIIMGNGDFSSEYKGSVVLYIAVSFIFKILFIIAYNALCMLFCYLIRNAGAYFLVIISMLLSSIGPICTTKFVSSHKFLKGIFNCTIMVQDYKMFLSKFNSGVYKLTFNNGLIYVIVMTVTIIILYEITCLIISKVEIK